MCKAYLVTPDKRCEMQETGNNILARLPSPLGDVSLALTDRLTCKKSEHPCMQAIMAEMVCDAAKNLENVT